MGNAALYTITTGTLMEMLVCAIGSVGVTNASIKSETKTGMSDGITFNYPSSWNLKERENRFTTIDATLEYDNSGKSARIVIEHDQEFSGIGTDRIERMLGLVYDESKTFESGSDKYIINNQTAPYVIAEVKLPNVFGGQVDLVVMAVAIQLGNNDGVLVQYVTHPNDFDKLLAEAEQIIQSIKATNDLGTFA